MTRMLRRALRQWKSEFMTVWLRLTAFHRIALGMIVAMGLIYGARVRLLDPLTAEVDELHEQLQDKGVPTPVPAIETDDELQQEQFRAESLRESLETWRAELATLEAASALQLDADEADAHAALLALANRQGVRVHAKSAVPGASDNAGRITRSAYTMRGRFPALFAFLGGLRDVPLLWELDAIHIELPPGAEDASTGVATGGAPELTLRFHLLLHHYERGGR